MSAPLAPNGRPLAEVYRSAAARVRRGWCQGTAAANADGRPVALVSADVTCLFCAMGALCLEGAPPSAAASDVFTPAEEALAEPLAVALFRAGEVPSSGGADSVVEWNDHTEQTSGHVARWFERVAASLEAEAGAP